MMTDDAKFALGFLAFRKHLGSATTMGEERVTEATFVDHDDVPGLEAWARVVCKDTTVDQLASMLGVAPTIEAIAARLGRTLPDDGAKAVARVCEEELLGIEGEQRP